MTTTPNPNRLAEILALLPKTASDVMPGTSHEVQALRKEFAHLGGTFDLLFKETRR